MPVPTPTSFVAGSITVSGFVSNIGGTSTVTTGDTSPNFTGLGTSTTNPGNVFYIPQAGADQGFEWDWGISGDTSGTDAGNVSIHPGQNFAPQTIGNQQVIAGATGDTWTLNVAFAVDSANPNADNLVPQNNGAETLIFGGVSLGDGTNQSISGTGDSGALGLTALIEGMNINGATAGDTLAVTFTLTDTTNPTGGNQGSGVSKWTEYMQVACYAAGTRIATPSGETAVEDLRIGDLVATATGIAKPVKWVGRRSYDATTLAAVVNLRPVLVHRDALGAGLPARDLRVSPMHSLFINEVFIPAASLVNGVSVLRDDAARSVDYIHIELDAHDVIFAEGVTAETYVDDDSRAMFENASEYYDLYGTAEDRQAFSAPRVDQGYQLEAVRRRIGAQAGIAIFAEAPGSLAGHVERLADGVLEGWVMDLSNPGIPVELEVLVDGEIAATVLSNRYRVDLDRAGMAGGSCAFTVTLPPSALDISQVQVRRATDGRAVAKPARSRIAA